MSELYTNDPSTTLNGTIAPADPSLIVASATGFPGSGNFRIRIDSELMLVTACAGTTWTITRGIEGTTAATHNNGATINHFLTAGALTQILLENQTVISSILVQQQYSLGAYTVTLPMAVTRGNKIVVATSYENGSSVSTVTDSLGTTYTQVVTAQKPGQSRGCIFTGTAISSGANTITLTATGAIYLVMYAAEMRVISGDLVTTSSNTTGATSITITTTAPNDFIIGVCVCYANSYTPYAMMPLTSFWYINGSDALGVGGMIAQVPGTYPVVFAGVGTSQTIVAAAFRI